MYRYYNTESWSCDSLGCAVLEYLDEGLPNPVEKFSLGERLGLDFAESGLIRVFLAVRTKQ